jgi:anti-anti-sigma regulatory factor
MDLEMIGSSESTVLKLKGNWTIERAGELKPALLKALQSSDQIVIDLEELTDTDLSAIQLLCSAHAASLRLGKQLAFHHQKSEPFKRAVRDAGLARTVGCHRNPTTSCLWTGDWTS